MVRESLEARRATATLVTMETSTDHHPDRWIATGNEHDEHDEHEVLRWVADRSAAAERHLVPVAAVGRTPTGRLVVDLDRPTGTPLVPALDRLGTPTTGVAVTLTVPLLELLVAVHDGAVLLGTAGIDDVLVDDSGAVVLCDRPTNATNATNPSNATNPTNRTKATTPTRTAHAIDATRTLVLAARSVWDRVDPADPAQAPVLGALQDALDGDGPSARAALEVVRAAAAPRPFRWTPVPSDLVFAEPPTPDGQDGLLDRLRDAVEHGVPLGAGRRLPLRRVLVGLVVTVGSVVAALTLLGGG